MSLAMPNAVTGVSATLDTPYLELSWQDPESPARGYLVLDRLVRGVASGGLRMRADCSLTEVRGLARGMTLKEAIHYEPGARYVPLGGAKGGIDFDPYHPEAEGVLRRYLAAMRAMIERHWALGEDFGIRQATIDRTIPAVGLNSPVQAALELLDDPDAARARLRTAFAAIVDGIRLEELVGGYGVAESAFAALRQRGLAPEESTAFVQGFGSMGGATARYLARAGVRVVGIADVHGTVTNPAGLDVENLLAHRDPTGAVNRERLRARDRTGPGADWLEVPCDVLVPAAMSYCVDAANQQRLTAGIIVEAANMPVTPEAEEALRARGTWLVPDFLANSATNAWWWWVLFGDIDGSAEQSFTKITERFGALCEQVFQHAERHETGLRQAAFSLAEQRLDQVSTTFPALG